MEDNTPSKLPPKNMDMKAHQTKKESPISPFNQRELLSRPRPDPAPGPIIVEVFLVRGTSNDFGFSIAGGVGTELLEGDSGIFITQVY